MARKRKVTGSGLLSSVEEERSGGAIVNSNVSSNSDSSRSDRKKKTVTGSDLLSAVEQERQTSGKSTQPVSVGTTSTSKKGVISKTGKSFGDTPTAGGLASKQLGLTKRSGRLSVLKQQTDGGPTSKNDLNYSRTMQDYARESRDYEQAYQEYEDYLSKYSDYYSRDSTQKRLDDAKQELSDQYQRSGVQNAVSRYGQYIPEQYQKQVRDYAAGASKARQSELLGTIDQASSRISFLDSADEKERLLGLDLDLLKERITVKKRQQTEQLRRYTKEHGYAGNITFDELDADLNAEIEQLQAEYDKAYNLQWRRDQSSKYNALSQNADYADNTGYRPELARRDTAYAAINGDQQHRQGNSGKGITLIGNEDKYDYLSEDERSTYNYLYNTQGYQSAEDYLDYLSYDLNERRQSAKYKATSDFAGKNVGTGIISSALSVPANLASGIGAIDIGIQRAANAESGRPVDFNSAWQDPYYYTNTVRSTISNNLDTKYGTLSDSIPVIGGQGLGFLYQTGMSMADSAAIAGLTMATGIPEVAGTSLLGGSAAVASMHDAHNNGLSDGQAIATGVLAGIAETAFEYISLDKLMAKPALVGGTKATQFKNWLVQTAKQAGVEGSEEFFTTAANLLSDFIVNGDQSDIKSTYQQYLNQGYSASEAAARTFGDELSGAVLDFAGGFISGGVMGGVKMGTSAIQNARANTDVSTGRQIIRADNVHRLLILADRLQENGEIYQLVSEQARQENPNYNAAQVGQLAQAVEQSPQSAAIQERLSALGVTEGTTELSDAIYRRANAKSMTEEQEQLLESNKSARQVAEELTQAVRGKKTEDNGWAHDAVNVTRGARSYRSKMPDEDVRFRDAVVDRSVGLSAQAETQAQIKESETPVTITGIKRTAMKDGGLSVIVKDESGNTSAVKLQELTRLPGPTHTLIQEALRYGPDASIMFATYSDGQTVGRYADTWAAGYEAGVRGQEMPSPSYEGYNTAMQMAYETGKSRAAADLETRKRGNVQEGRQKTQSKAERVKRTENRAKGKTPASGTVSYDGGTLTAGDVTYRLRSVDRNAMDSYQKQAASAVEMLVKAGVVKRAVFFESDVKNGKFEAFNGAYQDGTIYVDINAGKTKPGDHRRVILQTFAHELTHSLENTEAYGELSRFVLEHIGENQLDEIKTRLTDTGLYSDSELDHEIVANACAEVLYDSEAVRALAKENRTLFERVRDFIHDLIQKIRDVYKQENSFRQESILMRDVTDQLAELWDSALLEKVGTGDDLSAVEQEEFSMREPVEETKDLLALHNLTEENLRDVLKLGGFPMPSVAIVKAEQGHSKYGPISLVLPRASIDPETDVRNHIFGADAYTPTAPEVEYPVNYDRLLEVEQTLNNLSKDVANGIFANSSLIRSLGIDDSSSMSVDQLAEKLAGRDTVQAAYLADHGKTVEPVLSDKVWNKYGNDLLQTLVDQIGEQRLAEINANFALGMQASESLGPDAETIRNQLREYYRKAGEASLQRMAKRNGWSQDEIEAKRQSRIDRSMENNVSMFTLEQIARDAWDMYLDKGKTKGEVDRMATLNALREQVNHSDVKEWLQGKLSGLLGEPGIYNGKERYTPSGNSRSFSQLHYAYTAENIVRAMTEAQKQRGEKVFAPNSTALMSTATPEYGSISDVKQDSGRLQTVDDQEYKDLLDEIDDSIGNVITKVRQQNEPHSDNSFEEMDIIGSILVSSATGKHTPVAIIRAFAKEGYTIDKDTARMIQALYHSAAQMPTGYFEAKPERVVQYNEALAVVVPENMDSELMKQVTAAGMPVRTYAAGDEQSRLEAINSVEGAKFSYREDAVQKDEIETGIRIAAQSKAVTSVSAYAGSLKASDVVKAVGDFFDSVGGTVENPQLGDVTLGRRGIKSDLAHGVGRNKVAAFMAVPSILERGNVVDYQVNWKGRGYDTAVVAAPIQIEGVAYLAGVLLKRSNSVNRFYVHEVLTIEEGTALFNQAALQNEDVDSGSDVPSMNSILQRVLDVKDQISAAEHTAEAGDDETAQRIALEQSGAEFSARVTDEDTLKWLENLDGDQLITTYRSMQLIDGKLYPPMAAVVSGKMEDASEIGTWEMAVEHPELVKIGKNGKAKFTLNKGNGQGSLDAAYNPYMHSSNLMLNDQFTGAYRRPNLVTVECVVPASESSSGYQAEYAKDRTGWHDWHAGPVASRLTEQRQVYLSRWLKPVRILSDSEVAQEYKRLLEGRNISVPYNVVSPSLLQELEKIGVPIDNKGSGKVPARTKQPRYSARDSENRQLTEGQREYFADSVARDNNGRLLVMYHGTPKGGFTQFRDWAYMTASRPYAERYANQNSENAAVYETYVNMTNPFDTRIPEVREIWENEFFGNYSRTPLQDTGLPDWTDGYDLAEFIEENGYDYDGILLDEGADPGQNGEVVERGISYVVRSSEQIKRTDNRNPTSDPDIRYSARVYEQTDDEILSALDTSSLHTQAERESYFRWERRRAQYQNWQNTVDELRRQYDAIEDKSSSEARNLAARIRAFTAQIDNAIQRSDEALSGSKALQDVLSRERADMLVKDIRGNLSEEQRQALYRLNREARSLRRRLAELQRQGTVTTAESAQINQSDLKRFASALTQGTSIDPSSIMYELSNLTSAIMQGGSIGDQLLGWNEMYDMANSIADKVVSAYQLDISEIDDRYADIIGKTMTVPAYIRSDVRAEGLDAMARNAGIRLKFTDDTHSGLEDFVAQTPGVADDSAPLVTQLGDIVYSVLALQQTAADQIDVRQETESLAQTILDGVMDIAQQHTTADRVQAKRENAIQRERTKAEQKLEHTTEKYEAKLQKAKKKLVETRKSMQKKATQRVREARQKQHLLDMTEKKRQDVARRERSAARGLRDKILRHASDMSRKLLHPSDKQHIPEQLRVSVAAVLDAINLTSKKDVESSADLTKRTQAFEAAREAYQQILQENNGEMVVDPSLVGENGDGYFDQLIALRNTPIAKMNNQQLQLVWDTLKAVEASIQNAGKALSDAKYQRISQWADAFRTDTASRKVKKTITKSHFMLDMETPLTFFSHFGAAGDAVYRMLRDAQDRQQVMVDEVAADVQQLMGDNPLKTLREAKKDIKTFRFADGELTLSADQRMEVYLLMQRQQAQEHLLIGGIVQPEVTYAKRTIRRGNRAVHMSLDELSQITSALTANQIKLADGLQTIMSGRLSDYGNQASMQAYGYQKFREKNYWPIKTASEETHSSVEKGGDNTISVKNFGMAKSTVAHANNGVDLSGVFDTFARHASEMTTYAAWLCPMEDAGRLYNWKYSEYNDDGVRQTTGTIKGVLNDVGGSGAANYWMNLMADIQSGIGDTKDSAMGSIPAKLLGNAKGAAVGANLRVVIQQPTALFRAMTLWSPADLMRGLAGGATKGGGFKRAERYSPIAARKAQGGFDISSGNQMQEILYGDSSRLKRISNALSWGAGKADEITWGYLWNCAERKVQKESNLDVGTDAFYAEVNRRFTEMIDATQVVDGVLQRSQVMRSSNAWNKMATAFMGEPTMSFNVMMRAVDQFLYESDGAKRGKAVGKILRGASALLVTAAVNGVMKSLIDAVRDDDKDKDFWDRFIAAFSGVDGTESNAFQRMFNIMFSGNVIGDVNPLMQLPYVKDVISVMQGYDVGRMDMDAVSELVDCGKNVMNALQGDSNKTLAYTLEKLAAKIADLSGISVNNITRDLWSLLRTVVSGQENYYVEYQMEKAIYDLSSDKNKSRYMEILMRAYLNDSDAYSAIERDILDSGVYTSEDIGDYMTNYWKDGVKAASDDLALEEQNRLKEQMIESGFMSEDDADGYLTKYRLLLENPDFDGDITTQQAEKYYDIAEPAGIDLSVFYALTQQYSSAENEKDAEGKNIEGKTKKDKVMAWINSQSLSSSQKDTLYLVYYKESTLSDAPWH